MQFETTKDSSFLFTQSVYALFKHFVQILNQSFCDFEGFSDTDVNKDLETGCSEFRILYS